MTEVYKFGGASVKDAEGIRNLVNIVSSIPKDKLLIVVSAMGKTTNSLEAVLNAYYDKGTNTQELLNAVKSYHNTLIKELFDDEAHPVYDDIANTFVEIDWILEEEPYDSYEYLYDQIVSVGELVSSKIISHYLNQCGITNQWVDARSYILTDNTYTRGKVDWDKTSKKISEQLVQVLDSKYIVTQGFIAGTSENFTTTLGREGSDYSAAIFASCLKAESVTIWKDVPGVLNADPKLFSNTKKYDVLSYREAIEMTYYGATVIHPKTIKPLQNNNIPLFVKPFHSPEESGTCIMDTDIVATEPAVIIKNRQILISMSTKDLSFITESHISTIYKNLSDSAIKMNMVQVGATSLSGCIDHDERKFPALISLLEQNFMVKYNDGLLLITMRHFQRDLLNELTKGQIIMLEQNSRNTAQVVLKQKE
ncbi:aspartate kinase [Arcticibacter eurypsychrophilus]|uniref:aspartate kinase n=1 Tax=Arcticibacter eurypsychrophilus TaxID=1434752 RepID=UPI00084DFE3B|nr:aspartate kinase [Arcticibacter eurypsychrophilus]